MTASRTRSVGLGFIIIIVNVLIVALVAIGVSQRGFGGWLATLRGDWMPLEDALNVEDPLADALDDTAATTGPADDAVATTAPPPTEDPTEDPEPRTAAELYAEGEDLTVLVLGDRTGVHENDWPAAWGRMLSTERSVQIHSPSLSDPTQYGDPLDLGGGEAEVSIYNASYVDGTPEYTAERLNLLAAETPDVILLNYGRANTPQDLPDGLDELWSAIGSQFPAAEAYVVVAPPRLDGLEPTVDATREWAEEADAPVIDIAEEFEEQGIVFTTQSGRDPLAVNIPGNEIWAQLIHEEVLDAPVPSAPSEAGAAEPEPTEAAAPPLAEPAPAPQQADIAPYQPPPSAAYQPPYVAPHQPPVAPVPEPTEPVPTEPEPTGSEPTQPQPTDPEPTDPPPMEDPEPSDPPSEDASDLSRLLLGVGF